MYSPPIFHLVPAMVLAPCGGLDTGRVAHYAGSLPIGGGSGQSRLAIGTLLILRPEWLALG